MKRLPQIVLDTNVAIAFSNGNLIDFLTAIEYGQLNFQLQKIGRRAPTNDVWICAIARRQGLPVATLDGHFTPTPGITIEPWVKK